MATKKPRITITLSERQHDVLRAITQATGGSMSSVLVEVLEMSMPTFERMAVTFQRLRVARNLERDKVLGALEEAQNAIEPIALMAVGQADLFLARVEALADRPSRSEERSASSRPPPTNRGVTPLPQKPLKPSTGAASRPVRKPTVTRKNRP